MNELNCPNCKRRRKFSITERERYKCETCNKIFKQCKSKTCWNLVNYGFFCEKCVGKRVKNGGSAAATALFVTGAAAFKFLRKVK